MAPLIFIFGNGSGSIAVEQNREINIFTYREEIFEIGLGPARALQPGGLQPGRGMQAGECRQGGVQAGGF